MACGKRRVPIMDQPPLVLKNLGADPKRYEPEILRHLEQPPIGAIPNGVKPTFHKTLGGTATVKDIFQPGHKANASMVAEITAAFIVSGRRDLPDQHFTNISGNGATSTVRRISTSM
jgi:hypothetical protein